MTDSLGREGDLSDRHFVDTSQKIVLNSEGDPVLRLNAECDCGWSETNVIGASNSSTAHDDRSEFRIKIESDAVEAADVKEALSRGGLKPEAFVVTETSVANDGDIDE